tara:strand:+ start:235 stop:1887 length:1653 start_codon:yes stop_codon:yes gene_type:complete
MNFTDKKVMTNESNQTSNYNNPELNRKMLTKIIIETVKPIEMKTIMDAQNLIKKALENYVISEPDSEIIKDIPNTEAWKKKFLAEEKATPIKITAMDLEYFQKLNKSLAKSEETFKNVSLTKKNFHQKLNEEIASESSSIWSNMMDWIDKNFSPLITKDEIIDKALNRIMSTWVANTKQNLERLLESSIKDYLHSLVNKTIILSKITGKDGWKEKIATFQIKDHRYIQSIEKEIKSDLKKLTTDYDAPFMTTFSNELFTRCYKHLVSPIKKPKEPSTISELTGDIKSKSFKKYQWPIDIQEEFDIEYLEFLKTICNNKPNIKIYAKIKFKSLKSIAKNTTLSDMEKSEIRAIYFKIYKLSRRYEKLLTVLEQKNNTILEKSNEEIIRCICHNIEMSHHGFRPFLMSFIQQLQLSFQMVNRNLRKTNIKEYTESLKALQKITETLELTRLLNQHFEKNTSLGQLNEDDWLKKFMNNKKGNLKKSIEPWGSHEWNEFLNHIIELIEIKKRPQSSKRVLVTSAASENKEQVSTLIKQEPITESDNNSSLNNAA